MSKKRSFQAFATSLRGSVVPLPSKGVGKQDTKKKRGSTACCLDSPDNWEPFCCDPYPTLDAVKTRGELETRLETLLHYATAGSPRDFGIPQRVACLRFVSGLLRWRQQDVVLLAAVGHQLAEKCGDKSHEFVDVFVRTLMELFSALIDGCARSELLGLFVSATSTHVYGARCDDDCEPTLLRIQTKDKIRSELLFLSFDVLVVMPHIDKHMLHSVIFRKGRLLCSLPYNTKAVRTWVTDMVIATVTRTIHDRIVRALFSYKSMASSTSSAVRAAKHWFLSFSADSGAVQVATFVPHAREVMRKTALQVATLSTVAVLGDPISYVAYLLPPCLSSAFQRLARGEQWPTSQYQSRFALAVFISQLGFSSQGASAIWKELHRGYFAKQSQLARYLSIMKNIYASTGVPKYAQLGCKHLVTHSGPGSVVYCPFSGTCSDADIESALAPYSISATAIAQAVVSSRCGNRSFTCGRVFDIHTERLHGIQRAATAFTPSGLTRKIGRMPAYWTLTYANLLRGVSGE